MSYNNSALRPEFTPPSASLKSNLVLAPIVATNSTFLGILLLSSKDFTIESFEKTSNLK